jgi:histidyl-tRNA synthetase
MRFSEQGRRDLEQWQSNGSNGVLNDDRIRKALARSLGTSTGTTTAEGSRFTEDVREYKQDNQSVKEAFKSLLESISETDQTRNEHLNKLVRLVNNLSDQVQDFNTKRNLDKQLQVLEMQVLKLKK